MRININGTEYASPDEMPPDVRRSYEDALRLLAPAERRGVEAALAGQPLEPGTITVRRYDVDGTRYSSLDEMPPAQRELFERLETGAAGTRAQRIDQTISVTVSSSFGSGTAQRSGLRLAAIGAVVLLLALLFVLLS